MLDITQNLRSYFDSDVTRSYKWRKKQLKALIRMLETEREAFEEALYKDLGKTAQEAWITEIGFVIHEAKYALSHLRSWMRLKPHFSPLFLFPSISATCAEPRGLALIISPWNYPLQLALSPLISSIAAGNVTIIKPSEISQNTSLLIAQMLNKYMDTNAIITVEGDAETTQRLLREPIDFVFFTGSTRTAKAIATTCAENLTPYVLELGGKSPTIILNVKNIEHVANRIAFAKFTNAGQTCVAPDYVLIAQPLLERFKAALICAIRRMFPQPDSMAHLINPSHLKRLSDMLGHGEEIILGGRSDVETLRMEATIVKINDPTHPLMQEEIFGPILPILTLNSNEPLQEAREIIRQHPNPLALYVFSDKLKDARWIHDHISSGNFVRNDALMHVSNVKLPFGGIGASGQGVSHGFAGFESFSHIKGSLWNTNRFDMQLRYPPYEEKTFRWIERFLRF